MTDEVIENITTVYNENSPDYLYFVTLYNIFNEFLEDVSEDVLPNEATGFKESKIWGMLYNFQKDAALAIINKLEKYNGCILADSVGLTEFAIKKSETVFTIFDEEHPFLVTWSHYLQLMRIENEDERSFYEIEAAREKWGVRDLSRQYNSSLYERLALSRNKDQVHRLSQEGNVITTSKDVLKDPYVLEFVGLDDKYSYSETDLENRLLDNLQQFLLELGKGFTFVARQKRFSFEEDHFRVDLVFYNRLLKCFVLFDLKIGKLKHQDLGQMQMYVNYYDRYEKTEEENPTIGVLLCNEKNDAMVELTLPEDSNIYASQYKLYLPDKKLLQDKLKEWLQEEGGAEDEI